MNRRLFKIILMNHEVNRLIGEEPMNRLVKAAISSKDEFNQKWAGKKHIFLSSVDRLKLVLVLCVSPENSQYPYNSRIISEFYSLIYKKLKGLGEAFDRRFLKMSVFKEIDSEELDSLINQAMEKNPETYNERDAVEISGKTDHDELSANDRSYDEDAEDTEEMIDADKSTIPATTPLTKSKNISPQNEHLFGSYEEVMSDLNNLVGMNGAKNTIKEIVRLIQNTEVRNRILNLDSTLNCNVAIAGDKGTGKDTLARILFKLYYHLGINKFPNFIKIESQNITQWRPIEIAVKGIQGGYVYLDRIDAILPDPGDRFVRAANEKLDNLIAEIDKYSGQNGKFVFMISGSPEGVKKFIEYKKTHFIFKFQVHIENYTTDELIQFIRETANKKGYQITISAEGKVRSYLNQLMKEEKQIDLNIASNLVCDAIIQHGLRVDYSMCDDEEMRNLGPEDFKLKTESEVEEQITKPNPFEELDSLIGLEPVKKRIKEISAYAAIMKKRQESGLNAEPLSLHMCLTGSPGTAKTTVARLIGYILRDLGVLKSGHTVMVTREDLVAGYVGQTAIKTKEKINQAINGVLFIDEFYSLWSGNNSDFGFESVAELVAAMENKRNELVVIMAGYKEESERVFSMNPGLRDRVQFKIDFQDYTPDELYSIFESFSENQKYHFDMPAKEEVFKIIKLLWGARDENFSNGRMMRKLFNRIQLAQSMRIFNSNLFTNDELTQITIEDVKALYMDEDIKRHIHITPRRQIGFIA